MATIAPVGTFDPPAPADGRADASARVRVRILEERLAQRTGELAGEVAAHERTRSALAVAVAAAEQSGLRMRSHLACMSHDLRTPLNAILGYSEMLKEDAADQGRTVVVDDLGKIIAAGRHVLALISDLQDEP